MKTNCSVVIALVLWFLFWATNVFAMFHSPYRGERNRRIGSLLLVMATVLLPARQANQSKQFRRLKKMSKKIWYLGLGHDGQWQCVQFPEGSATDFRLGPNKTEQQT